MVDEAHLAELQHECAAIEAARADAWRAAGRALVALRRCDPETAWALVLEYDWLPEAARQAGGSIDAALFLTSCERLEIAAGRLRGLLARQGPSGARAVLPEVLELVHVLADWLEEDEEAQRVYAKPEDA